MGLWFVHGQQKFFQSSFIAPSTRAFALECPQELNPIEAMLCQFANKRWDSPEQVQPSKGSIGPPKNLVFLLHQTLTCDYRSPLVKEVVSAIHCSRLADSFLALSAMRVSVRSL